MPATRFTRLKKMKFRFINLCKAHSNYVADLELEHQQCEPETHSLLCRSVAGSLIIHFLAEPLGVKL